MTSLRILYHMMKADYLERMRRYSFLITVMVSIFIVYKYIPSSDENYLTLSLGGIRSIYNSAWIGSAIAVLASMLLSLPAFFLVKNAIERDVQTGVGQIIATTPLTRWMYIMGKMWSNFVLLMSIVVVLIVSALALQFIRGEVYTVDLVKLLLPFIYSTLPTMALVAALAIFFESVPLLRSGFGNFIYFILWIFSLKFSTTAINSKQDIFGISPMITKMSSEASARLPNNNGGHISGISPLKGELTTYDWAGVQWTLQMFVDRYIWILVAFIFVAVASIFFHRFDLTRMAKINKKDKSMDPKKADIYINSINKNHIEIKLTPYSTTRVHSNYVQTLALELRLMLKGLHLWWYLVALLMIGLGLFLPMNTVVEFILPLTWFWPVLIWSAMGTNETFYRTHQLIFTAVHPIRNQFIVLWLAGIIVSYLTGSGVIIHFLVAGEWESLKAMAVGGLFIPTLALTLGIWSGNGRLFQVVFMLMWYMGPLNKMDALDFIGTSKSSVDLGFYWYYLLATFIMLLIAVIGRMRQVKTYK